MTLRRLLLLCATAAAIVAAVALNLVLLSAASAQSSPLGRLNPAKHLPAAPAWTVRPRTGPVHDLGSDD